MSASSGPLASTKGDSTSSKPNKQTYDHLDINKLYKGKSTEPAAKPVAQKHGMQILGKAIPARRPGQLSSVKAESSSNDASSSATSTTTSTGQANTTSSALAASNQSQAPPGWSSSAPRPPGPPSPRSVPAAPITGHHHDKNWGSGPEARSGSYESQRFAQEFPSLASGTETAKAPQANASGPSSNVQGSQPVSKTQDNQYGPGPVLRPQTEGSWIQGGGRGVRPPGPAPPSTAPSREFQGPDRANLGGPTPPPMSLGQGGPAPPPLGFQIPPTYRGGGMHPPHGYMFPNGPPAPGPGYYPPGGNMPRFGMPRPPPPPSGGSDGPPREMNRGRPPPPQSQRPTVFTGPIIREEELKSMDKLGSSDGGWASIPDDIDYNKTLHFSDDEDSKENAKRPEHKGSENRADQKGDRDRGRDREENITIQRRPTKILDRQSSTGEKEIRDRDREQRDSRYENPPPPNKDNGYPRGGSYGYDNEEDWKSQQMPMPPPQQQQRRVNLNEDSKNTDRRDDRRDNRDRDLRGDRRDDRGGPRRPFDRRDDGPGDNWRSASRRQFDDEQKGPPMRGRDEPRSDVRDFPVKASNLPPRFQRQQQYQSGPGGPQINQNQQQQQQPNQRQTPSPGSSGGKDREFSSNRDWEREKNLQDRRRMDMESNRKQRDERGRDRYYNEYDSRNDRMSEKESKSSRYGSDFQRERSKESDDSKTGSSSGSGIARSGSNTELPKQSPPEGKESLKKEESKPMTSWADEMDDYENNGTREPERKREPSPKPVSQPKEPRRVFIKQTKISDMPPSKPEPQVEVRQSSETVNKQDHHHDQGEKAKPVWGEKEGGWERGSGRQEKESSPPQRQDRSSAGGDNESGRSYDRDYQSNKRQSPPTSSQHSSGPGTHRSSDSPTTTNGPSSDGARGAPISKSASARSISGEAESHASAESQEHHREQRSNSISDASDRDHHEREGHNTRSKPSYDRQTSMDKTSSGGSTSGYDSKPKQRPGDRDRDRERERDRDRRVKRDSDRDGSDVGSEHGGSRGDKSQRGQRRGDRGNYPTYRTTRGDRGGWDRGGMRSRGGRGRGGTGRDGHYERAYEKIPRKDDAEKDQLMKDDVPNDTEATKAEPIGEEPQEKIEKQPPKKDSEPSEGYPESKDAPRPKKDKEMENNAKKSGRDKPREERGNKRSNNARNGSKLEGYGPPSDKTPFSTGSNKDDEAADKKEKSDTGLPPAKEGGIPSLMAVDISPPTLPPLKKGHRGEREREREYHSGRGAVPPRMQGQRGDTHSERDRHLGRGGKRGKDGAAPPPPSSNAKKEGEESEEWTDNDSDAESRKSGSASSKLKKDGNQEGKKAVKKPPSDKGFPTGTATSNKPSRETREPRNERTNEKGGKPIRVKNPPYDARSAAHSNLPPRLAAAKQRDSQGSVPAGNGKPGENSSSSKDSSATPQTNAWEKPITPTLRTDQTTASVSAAGATITPAPLVASSNKEAGDVSQASVSQISSTTGSNASAVLDGTNPPTRTLIFESRSYKGGVASEGVKSSVSSKLPETKKESITVASGIEFGKNLGSLGFGKGAGEESPELDFTSATLDDPMNIPQSQAPPSMMSSHHVSSPKPSNLLPQSSRHPTYDHQPSPTSRGDVELKQKMQSLRGLWENSEQSGEDNTFHAAFVSDSFKGADSTSRDFGPPSLPQSAVGYSGGSSPSISSMPNPETSSSPNANIRPTSKTPQQQQQQAPPAVTKPQAHGPGPIASPFGSYGIETAQHIGASNFGGIQVVPQHKYMYAPKMMPTDPFGSQMTQFTNAPPPNPYGQAASLVIQPKYQPVAMQQHGGSQNRPPGQPSNHNSVSPGPITSSAGANAGSGAHINSRSNTMMSKNQQTNRNAAHVMTQPVPQQTQQNFYHAHNPMSLQQVPKGPFGPANGGYADGGMTPTYHQPQILIPVNPVDPAAMFNLGGSFESSDMRSGPPPQGPAPPGTPPVQAPPSSYYFSSNNNPAACVFPPNSSQSYGLPYTASLKMPPFNSAGAAGSDSASNLASQRLRANEQQYIQAGMDPLPQNAMKSGHSHDYLMNQPRWNSTNEFQVNQGVHWAAPGPIQRPIFNTPSAGPVGPVPLVHSSSHFMSPNIGAPPGCVGMKPNNSSNESMTNPGTPPKSPHPRKNV